MPTGPGRERKGKLSPWPTRGEKKTRSDGAIAGGRHGQYGGAQGIAQALLAIRSAGNHLLRRPGARDQRAARDRLPERRAVPEDAVARPGGLTPDRNSLAASSAK